MEGFNTRVGVDPYNRFVDDPCQRKHGGNIDSMIAWGRIREHINDIHEDILREYMASAVPISPKEFCEKWGKHPSDISGRFTELKQAGALVPTAETYKGSRRLELTERWVERVLQCDLRNVGSAEEKKVRQPRFDIKWKGFTTEQILEWNKACRYADNFTEFLNAKIREEINKLGVRCS